MPIDPASRSNGSPPCAGSAHHASGAAPPAGPSPVPAMAGDRVEPAGPRAAADSAASKDAALGAVAHRLMPHRYEVRSIDPKPDAAGVPRNTSVAGIFDRQSNVRGGVAHGSFEVRFDGPHGYRGALLGPHLNLGTGEHRAIPVPASVVEGAGKAARALEALDKVALPFAVAVDSARLGEAFAADGNRVGPQTQTTAGSVAGGWAGAFGGAWAGAEAGAVLGAFGGPPGAAIGAVAGGLAGGLGGSFGGAAAGEAVVRAATHAP